MKIWAEAFERVGLPKSIGHVYGHLLLSSQLKSLDNIVDDVSISKASASTAARFLLARRAIRKLWIPGERTDFYAATPDVAGFVRTLYVDFVIKPLDEIGVGLEGVVAELQDDRARGLMTSAELAHSSAVLKGVLSAHQRLSKINRYAEKTLEND